MSDFNDIFKDYPDYDVFDDNKSDIGKKPKAYGSDEFIEYNEKRNFPRATPQVKEYEPELEEEHSTDYGDDFGVYKVYEEKVRNYATIFFFPIVIILLESVLRLGCGQPLLSGNMFFVVMFSLSFSALLTTVCTLFGERFNRALVSIISIALSVLYCGQIVSFDLTGSFMSFSQGVAVEQSLAGFQAVMDSMSDKVYYLLACFAPSVLQLFLGRFIFPFRRTPLPAKVCLLLAAVLLYFSAITVIHFDRKSVNGNYATYYQAENLGDVQEKFGLITMEIKDIVH